MSSSQSAVWQRLPERSFKARSSNIIVKLIPNSLNSQGAAPFLTALYYILSAILLGNSVPPLVLAFLLLVNANAWARCYRQVINKMHVSSKTCPQATNQERKVYVNLVPSVPENCNCHRIVSEHACRYPSELCLDNNHSYPSWPPDVNAILSAEGT